MPEALIYVAEKLDTKLFTGVLESRQALGNATMLLLEQKTGKDESLNRAVSAHLLLTVCNPHRGVLGKHHHFIKLKRKCQIKATVTSVCDLPLTDQKRQASHCKNRLAPREHTGIIRPVQRRQQQMLPPATALVAHIPGF